MKLSTEQLRALLDKKLARLVQLQQEVDALRKRVVEAENEEIITTIRSLCVQPEDIASLLQALQGKKGDAPVSHTDEIVLKEQEEIDHENFQEENE